MTTDLFTRIEELCDLNEQRVQDMRSAGVTHAENEAEYRKAKRIATLKERAKGTPVSLIRDLVQGDEHIAELKLKSDAAGEVRESIKEEIQVNKIRIATLREQLAREWSLAGQGGNY